MKNRKTPRIFTTAVKYKNTDGFPYDYHTIPLRNIKGSATIIGTPNQETIEALNAMAEIAFKNLK